MLHLLFFVILAALRNGRIPRRKRSAEPHCRSTTSPRRLRSSYKKNHTNHRLCMSFPTVNDSEGAGSSHPEPVSMAMDISRPKYKSYKYVPPITSRAPCADRVCRKKYMKMRHTFKERMRENNRLYEDEQHSERIARRLQEENEYTPLHSGHWGIR